MFEDRVPIGCDTCDHVQIDSSTGNAACDAGRVYTNGNSNCPNYRMSFNYFCQNHAQYDRHTGLMKKVNGNIISTS